MRNFFSKLRRIILGQFTDINKNGIPDHMEAQMNDRNHNMILDHLERELDLNGDGIPDTKVDLNSDLFSREVHIISPPDMDHDGVMEGFFVDMDGDGIPDYRDSFIDIDGDGIADIDFDIDDY